MEMIMQPPRTLMEVYDMLPEGTLAELINNQLYMSPAPSYGHHKITKTLAKELDKIVEDKGLGAVIFVPFDIKLDNSKNAVQPDLLVILKSNPNQIDVSGKYFGVPDLIVEILSPGNREYDLITKKELYEKFGVKEYWVVDPDTKLALIFSLKQNHYEKVGDAIAKISSPLLQAEFSF